MSCEICRQERNMMVMGIVFVVIIILAVLIFKSGIFKM